MSTSQDQLYQEFPTWSTSTPGVHLPISRGTLTVQLHKINFETKRVHLYISLNLKVL